MYEGGTLEIITFRSNRSDHPYWFPIQALIEGYSTGHVAMRLNFYDPKLFAKYIYGHPNIHHATSFDPKNRKTIYHVYLSFWPLDQYKNKHTSKESSLIDYVADCERSQNNSPISYAERFSAYLQPIHRVVFSRLPLLSKFVFSENLLPPSVILHLSRLQNAYGIQVAQAAQNYVEYYLKWRKSVIRQLNLESLGINAKLIAFHKKFCDKKLIHLIAQESVLQKLMFPDIVLEHKDFIHKIQEFITFGYPERDSISLAITDGYSPGVQLEPILAYIKQVADTPTKYPYGLLGLNCAAIIYQALYEGLKNTRFQTLKDALILPWYARLLGITLTPGLVFNIAVKLAEKISELKATTRVKEEKEVSTPLLTAGIQLDTPSPTLAFSQTAEDDDRDFVPTRILIIQNLCKFLESKLGRI